jgi:hypothetical protein
MRKVSHYICVLIATSLILLGVAACGGSADGPSGDIVAQVGSTPITRATLNHWMSTIVGGDYFELTSKVAPAGIVSDPPNYSRCQAIYEATSAKLPSGSPRPSAELLASKCRQLYEALKAQALNFLIETQWSVDHDAEQGIRVTSAEVNQRFKQYKAEEFSSEAQFQTYLADRRWSLSDDLFLIRKDLLSSKLIAKLSAEKRSPLVSGRESARRLRASTRCYTGYVVEDCTGYKAPATPAPVPETVVDALAAFQ